LKQSESLKKNIDFKIVYQKGKSYANRYLVMYIKKNDKQLNRLGVSVSKKVGNSVVRHRVSRLIKESYRQNEQLYKLGYDIVVVARVGAKDKSYQEIESALLHLSNLHQIIKRDDDL